MKAYACIFCEWEKRYPKENYNWDYVCEECCERAEIIDKWKAKRKIKEGVQ